MSELIMLSGEKQINLESLKAPIYIFILFKQPGGKGGSYYKNHRFSTVPQHSLMSLNACFTFSFNASS